MILNGGFRLDVVSTRTPEATAVKEQFPHGERTYLAVPYDERDQAKAIGARWDAVKKAWYVGPGVEPEKIAKWELRHEVGATVDPRAEFAAVDFGIDFIRCAAFRDKG